MTDVVIYTTQTCGYCQHAKALLRSKAVEFKEISVDGNRQARVDLLNKSGQFTVPQIWIGGQHIGGCDDLMALNAAGQLDQMLVAEC